MKLKLKTKIFGFSAMFVLLVTVISFSTIITVQDKVIGTAHEKLKGDLAALVGGRGDGHGLNPAKDSDSLEIRSGPLAAASHRSGNVGKRAPAAPKKKGKKMEEAVHKPKAVKPEQMIPLEEGDFKEF
jgi:hypothetical protein